MPPDITFRPVTAADYPLLRQWLRTAHWREWWGDPDEEFDNIRGMVEGRDSTRPFLIEIDGDPLGYIQVWSIGRHQTVEWIAEHPWLAELPADAVGVDLSIGDAAWLSRGVGSAALASFVAWLRSEGLETIVIDPDPANTRAVRAYAKAGFRPVPRLEGRTEGVLIMQHQLKADAIP
jgi:aminoglycoside 6'-N-acetyltransferase